MLSKINYNIKLIQLFILFLEYFKKNDVCVMSVKALFDFITDPTVNENNMDEYLDTVSNQIQERINHESCPDQEINEQVFKQAYIPQRLDQVIDIERDIKLAKSGKEDLIYKTLIGLKADLSKPNETPDIITDKSKKNIIDNDAKEEEEGESTCSDTEDTDDESSKENESKFVSSARPRNESPESKKVSFFF